MSTPFIVLSDQDAPLDDWESGLVRDVRAQNPHLAIADAGTRDTWDFHLECSPEESTAFKNAMNAPEFYRNLPAVPGSVETIRGLLDRGDEVFVVTTPSLDNPTCADDKLASLTERHGADVAARTILTFDKTVVRGNVLVDDKPKVTGLMTPEWTHMPFDEAYNQATPGPRVFGWDGFLDRDLSAFTRNEATFPFTILVDLDGVIFGWEEGIVDLARKNHPNVKIADAGTRTEWDFFPGTPDDEAFALREAMAAPGLFRNLPLLPGAKEMVEQMLNDGYNVLFNTSNALYNPTCASDKLAAVTEHFGRDMALRTVLTQDKSVIRGSILFDDKPKMTGLLTPTWDRVVVDQSYNQDTTGPRITNLLDWRKFVEPALALAA